MKRSSMLPFMLLAAACGSDQPLASGVQPLTAVCVPQATQAPAGAWFCPAPLTLACGERAPTLYVAGPACRSGQLTVSELATDRVGVQSVRVADATGAVVCETTVTVSDAVAPSLAPRVINLWPPNHKLHSISVEDCVGGLGMCDPDARAEFIWASSDEPIDSIGDGHHAPDIVFDCDRVLVRSERQGPKDGRVYKLGVRAVDGAGNVRLAECAVVVDHDQRGVLGADSGESYRISFDGSNGTPACSGVPTADAQVPPPPPPPARDAGSPEVVGI